MKITKKSFFITCLLLSVVFALPGCGGENGEQIQKIRPVEVKIIRVSRGDIHTEINATGTILPVREIFIGPRVSGRVEKLFADEGVFIEKAGLLVQLEQVRFNLTLRESDTCHWIKMTGWHKWAQPE